MIIYFSYILNTCEWIQGLGIFFQVFSSLFFLFITISKLVMSHTTNCIYVFLNKIIGQKKKTSLTWI